MCPTPLACGPCDRSTTTTSMDEAAGTGKHRLQVNRKIGRGAYGEVFKGTIDGQNVAIKVPDAGTKEADNIDMMRKESAVLSKCHHRRIIGYRALCTLTPHKRAACGRWALVLEYANGGSLSEKVSAQMISSVRRVYSTAQALGWALDLATALEYLHARSPMILHRDVKLSNVVLVDEGGTLVAKLADMGLHMVVDETKQRQFRASSIDNSDVLAVPPAAALSMTASAAAPVVVGQSQQLEPARSAAANGLAAASCTSSCVSIPAAATIGSSASTGQLSSAAAAAGQGVRRVSFDPATAAGPDLRRADSAQSSGSVRIAAAGTGSSTAGSLAQLVNRDAAAAILHPDVAAFAAAGVASSADCYAKLPADQQQQQQQQQQLDRARSDFDGSMLTDATWLTEAGASVAASTGTIAGLSGRGRGSSLDSCNWGSDFEMVFHMTGQTGSCMTMAPEVFLGQPYNEKADVFSFGVVLYELAARCLLIFTELPTHCTDPAITERYAAKVAKGYRPSKPRHVSAGVWQLVEACWQQEPCARPSMAKVVEVLQGLLADELASRPSARRARPGIASAAAAGHGCHTGATAAAGAAGSAGKDASCGGRVAAAAWPQAGCCVVS